MAMGAESFEEAFDALLRRALSAARRVLGDGPAAEDVAAEALARAYSHWPRVSGLAHREAWVARVAVNLAIDQVRRRRSFVDLVVDARDDEAAVDRLLVLAAVGRLPRRQREVVVLSYLSDASERDVAEQLGISAGTVKSHLHRALNALRANLGADPEEPGLVIE
jgi:RNA polymerase sigma-70 factor (sigma-E family)